VILRRLAAISLLVWITQRAKIRRACAARELHRDKLEKMVDIDTSALFSSICFAPTPTRDFTHALVTMTASATACAAR
jgi:hypothetical protein